jgi:hypothetical protein
MSKDAPSDKAPSQNNPKIPALPDQHSQFEEMKVFYRDANKLPQGSFHPKRLAAFLEYQRQRPSLLYRVRGGGERIHAFAHRGARVHGTDLSERAIKCWKHDFTTIT